MKTLKRIATLFLALMLIASVFAVSASAANQLTLTCDKEGFTFTIYRIASLNGDAYTYADDLDSSIVTAIKTPNQTGKAFLDIIDAASAANKNVGVSVGTVTSAAPMTLTQEGIYYACLTSRPDTTTKIGNSVIVWPQYQNGAWNYSNYQNNTVALGSKVDSGTDNITKYFTDDKTAASKTAGQGDVIQFTLEADVVGSTDVKATKYVIWDKMCKGLTYNNDMKVYLDETDATASFTIATEAITTDADAHYNGGTYFTVTANADTLSGNAFYGASKVYVKYTATLNNNATVGSAYNPNKDGLSYRLTGAAADTDKPGREVSVYTYELMVMKYDGSKTDDTTKTPLKGATFALYKAGTEIARGTSDDTGLVQFKAGTDANPLRLAPGEYTFKEIQAPQGYTLVNDEMSVTITNATDSDGIFNAAADGIKNYPVKLPETGGTGTFLFTLIGGCLVLMAGVIFVIAMKKKSAK